MISPLYLSIYNALIDFISWTSITRFVYIVNSMLVRVKKLLVGIKIFMSVNANNKELIKMYKGYAVYRFLDRDKKIIYIGMTNNARRRIYQQHFKDRGSAGQECYNSTARVDIVKLNNNLECKSLEEYLIDKYRPKFNKRDKTKNPFGTYGSIEHYDKMEKWHTYRKLKDFNYKMETDKSNNLFVASYIAILIGAALFSYLWR